MYVNFARLLVKCKSNSEISKWLCLCFGLLYLSLRKVSNVFAFTLETIMSFNHKVIKFLDYLVNNDISNDADILSHLWIDNSANLTRTKIACDSFHSHLKN